MRAIELVRDDQRIGVLEEQLRAWILDGGIERLRGNPLASYFTEAQRIQMPAYRECLDDEQIAALMRYVRWVNAGEWKDKALNLGH